MGCNCCNDNGKGKQDDGKPWRTETAQLSHNNTKSFLANGNAILAACGMELCVYDTPMYRPIPPMAIAIQSMLAAHCLVVCNFDTGIIEALTIPQFRSLGARSVANPMCVQPMIKDNEGTLAVASNLGVVHFWQRDKSSHVTLENSAQGNLQSIIPLPGHRILLTSYVKDKIFIYDLNTGKQLSECKCGGLLPWGAVSRSDGCVIIGTVKGVLLFSPEKNCIVKSKDFGRVASTTYGVFGCRILSDGRLACVDYYEKCLWFWSSDFDDDIPVSRMNIPFLPHDLCELPDATIVVSSHTEKKLYIYAPPPFGFPSPLNHPVLINVICPSSEVFGARIAGPTGLALAPMGLAIQATTN